MHPTTLSRPRRRAIKRSGTAHKYNRQNETATTVPKKQSKGFVRMVKFLFKKQTGLKRIAKWAIIILLVYTAFNAYNLFRKIRAIGYFPTIEEVDHAQKAIDASRARTPYHFQEEE